MPKIDFNKYETIGYYDEMFDEDHKVRPHYELFKQQIMKLGWKKLNFLQYSTDRAQLTIGMTFNVYGDNQGIERILHLDIIPRIIDKKDWDCLEVGLKSYALDTKEELRTMMPSVMFHTFEQEFYSKMAEIESKSSVW